MKSFVPLVIAAALLAGCAATPPNAPTTPTPTQIATQNSAVVATGIDPATYASVGETVALQACDDYFTQLITGNKQATFASSLVTLLGGAATGGAAAFGAGPAALALPGMLSALTTGGVSAYEQSTPGGDDPISAYSLVSRGMQAQIAALPPPATLADAQAEVQAVAANCRLPDIQLFLRQAAMTAPVSAAPVASASQLFRANAAAAPWRVQIPVVKVGP